MILYGKWCKIPSRHPKSLGNAVQVWHLELEGSILLRALGKVVTGEGGALEGLRGLGG